MLDKYTYHALELADMTSTVFMNRKDDPFFKLYSSIKSSLETVHDQLSKDLDGFIKQPGASRVAFMQQRFKDYDSFRNKVHNDCTKKLRNTKDAKDSRKVNLLTDFRDTIGARIIFYFEQDLDRAIAFFSVFAAFEIQEIKFFNPFGATLPNQKHFLKMAKNLNPDTKITPPDTKSDTNYESIHFILKYDKNNIIAREMANQAAKYEISVHDHIPHVPNLDPENYEIFDHAIFEVQVRTLLHHSWAHISHEMQYKPKTGPLPSVIHKDLFDQCFTTQKFSLTAAEINQNTITESYRKEKPKTTLRDIAGNISKRAHFYKECGGNDYFQEAINLSIMLDQVKSKNPNRKFREFDKNVKALEKKIGHGLLVRESPDSLYDWGRQRFLLIAVGHFLLFNSEETTKPTLAALRKRMSNFPGEPIYGALEIYEHIRQVDTFFRYRNEVGELATFFLDPLASYRAAGACFMINGQLLHGIHILEDIRKRNAINLTRVVIEDDVEFLNTKRLTRTLGQFKLSAYVASNYDLDFLISSLEELDSVFEIESEGQSSFSLNTDHRAAVIFIVIGAFLRYCGKIGFEAGKSQFHSSVSKYDESIDNYLTEEVSLGGSGLGALARALWRRIAFEEDVGELLDYVQNAISLETLRAHEQRLCSICLETLGRPASPSDRS